MKKKKRVKKQKYRFDKYFLLNWKKLYLVVIAWIVAVVMHNFVYGLFKAYFDAHGGDEPFFFIIAIFIIPAYFLISFIYTLYRYFVRVYWS